MSFFPYFKSSRFQGQLALILFPVFLFSCGGGLAYWRSGSLSLTAVLIPLFSGILFLACLYSWLKLRSAHSKSVKASAFLKSHWPLLALLVLCCMLRVPQDGTLLQDDGYTYQSLLTKTCTEFSFNPYYLFKNLRLAGHPSWGLAFLASIPHFFLPGSTNNFWLFHTVISALAAGCVYDLIRKSGQNSVAAFLGGLAFSCSPMLLGLASYPSLELAQAVFFVWMVWAYCRDYRLLLVCSTALTVFTKEFGIVLVFGFFVGAFLAQWVSHSGAGVRQAIVSALKTPRLVLLCAEGFVLGIFIINYLLNPAWSWFDVKEVVSNHDATHLGYIGFSSSYVLYKLQEALFVNFDWLLFLILLLCAGWRLLHRAPPLSENARIVLAGSSLSFLFYLLFSCLAVTYTLPRYSLSEEVLLTLCTVILLAESFSARPVSLLFLPLSLLLCIQSYFTIDPVMKAVYPTLNTGSLPMVRVAYTGGPHIGDFAVYNYQYTYLRRGMQEILAQNSPAEYDVIVLGRDGWLYLNTVSWDSEQKAIVPLTQEGAVPIAEYQTEPGHSNSLDAAQSEGILKSRAILLSSPTYAEDSLTSEQMLASIPACYTQVEEHVWDGGLAGEIVYFTADLVS